MAKAYVGSGRFFNVGASAKTLVGFAIAMFLGHPKQAVVGLKSLVKFDGRLRPHLITIFAELEGLQRDVFDALHRGWKEWVVVNYDFQNDPDKQDHAYGHVWPTTAEITAMVGKDPAEIATALAQLLEEGIVKVEDGRWAIVF